MGADIINSLVPFGIAGLAIVAIVMVVRNPKQTGNWLLAVAVAAIAMVFLGEKVLTPKGLEQAQTPEKTPDHPVGASGTSEAFWFFTGAKADWGGRDLAYTSGWEPTYKSHAGRALCDATLLGNVVTCWDDRSAGGGAQGAGVDSNVSPSENAWCAYKNNTVNLGVPPDGHAPPGRIYVCARPVARK